MQTTVGCKLKYVLPAQTGLVLQIEAANADGQSILSERLEIPAGIENRFFSSFTDTVTMTRMIRATVGPGPIEIGYEATVELDNRGIDSGLVAEFDFAALPMEYLTYIAPSRYCPSDVFAKFAFETFGPMPRGHNRVTAICDWIFANLNYQSGSTGPNSTAVDVFQSRMGVCRDYAHLGIAICRALGIPARYASVYAVALDLAGTSPLAAP